MKLKIINFLILIFILLQLVLPVALLAVEIAPRISDREIIEKLAILEVGQEALAIKVDGSSFWNEIRTGGLGSKA